MRIKDAFVRSARTAAQVLVGITLVVGPIIAALPDGFKVGGVDVKSATSVAFGVIAAVAAGLVAFAQNLAEDNTAFQLPK